MQIIVTLHLHPANQITSEISYLLLQFPSVKLLPAQWHISKCMAARRAWSIFSKEKMAANSKLQ